MTTGFFATGGVRASAASEDDRIVPIGSLRRPPTQASPRAVTRIFVRCAPSVFCHPHPRLHHSIADRDGGDGDGRLVVIDHHNHQPYLIAPPPQNQTQCAIISTILYAHPRLPLFLAGRGDLSKETTLYSVVGSLVKPLHTFPASAADPSPVFRLEGRNLRLRLLDGSWVLLMQSNEGGMVVLESGTTGRGEPASPETSLLKTPNGSDSADVVDVDMDENVAGKNDSYEAMLESVDSERRRRAANRASSLNVLDVVAPTEDVQTLPFHLAYAVLVERRGAMGLKGARRTCSMGRSLGTILVFVAWVGVRWLMIVPTTGQ